MSYFCRITPTASQDIENIMDDLANRVSFETAELFLNKLNDKFKLLIKFPQMGRRRDELYLGLRSLPLENYLIFYRLVSGEIEVMRVLAGYRNLEGLFTENNEK